MLCVLMLCFGLAGHAQHSKESLEREIKALQKDIETANKLLKETSKNKEVTLNQVSLMDKKIKNRQKLINAYNEQIQVLEKHISQGEDNIKTLNGELRKLRLQSGHATAEIHPAVHRGKENQNGSDYRYPEKGER